LKEEFTGITPLCWMIDWISDLFNKALDVKIHTSTQVITLF
jgi:hypothetical protein